ncbi:hypothetical protein R3P38DRAFT_2563780 [Favolaschia claudopus]|uniref:Uncharacterized protein n=1 Tax=Favolaschia claudopus TaxID=2862362 RepID=A0AAW0A1F0_9AGAR
MDALFTTPEDFAYLRRETRRIDASGVEAQKRQNIVDFRARTAVMHREKAAAKAKHEADVLRENLLRPLVSFGEMGSLTVAKIVDQLNSYRARGVPNILKVSNYKLKADKLAALQAAYHWYQANQASLPIAALPSATVQSTGQVIDDWAADEDVEMEE